MGNMINCEVNNSDTVKHQRKKCSAPVGISYRSLHKVGVEKKEKILFEKLDNFENNNSLINMVHKNAISQKLIFKGPFGLRRCIYMDNAASGQSLKCIEDFIQDHVLPFYGNTHTTATVTSSQTTSYREEARDIIRECVGAGENDVVIFCGSGCTRAIHKLVDALALNKMPLVVFVGPYEHHSNILPWREANAKMIYVPETATGLIDIHFLEEALKVEATKAKKKNKFLIGAFSVISNVTGIPIDDIEVTELLHKYGAMSFWDYSAAAAHVDIYMNPGETISTYKDAIYFSGHKFVGGPQTPGVLVAKRFLFEKKRASDGGGGGSVFYVTKDAHTYLKNIEFREESGTPGIVESIRLGLAFSLKNAVRAERILAIEDNFVKMIFERWSKIPEIKILAHNNYPRTATISFLIQQLDIGLYLHHNFVVALLNDLFGIQTRGSCGCAGPYSQSLLGIDLNLAYNYKDLLLDYRQDSNPFRKQERESECEIFKPGFVRVSISFYCSKKDVEYVIEAVEFVAKNGYMFLPLYNYSITTGAFSAKHRIENQNKLKFTAFDGDGLRLKQDYNNCEDKNCPNYAECLQDAENFVNYAREIAQNLATLQSPIEFNTELRWFVHQKEALDLLQNKKKITPKIPPFVVTHYDSINSEQLNSVKQDSVLSQLMVHYNVFNSINIQE